MSYSADNLENRFDEFVEEINKKIKELEIMILSLKSELSLNRRETTKVSVFNQDLKNSLGATIKTVGDIVGKN